jgi:hypothetical protein
LVIDVKTVEDDAGQSAFEAAQRFRVRGAHVKSFAVVGTTEAIEADWVTAIRCRAALS